MKAAGEGDLAAVILFLDSGGDVDAKSKTGQRCELLLPPLPLIPFAIFFFVVFHVFPCHILFLDDLWVENITG